jgi:DNA-binding protein HU-beta
MNKAQLADSMAKKAGISKKQACSILNSLTEAVCGSLQKSRKINLIGLGIFSVSKRAGRNGRNPQTGALIRIQERRIAKFKAAWELSDALNGAQQKGHILDYK